MANPFKAFRKYQKSAFVALGIVTMLAFIVIPILMQWENAVLQSRDVTLATSQYGKIQYRSIQNLRDEIQVLTRFYSSAGSQINSETQQSPAGLRNRYESLIRLSDEAVVYYWLKIQKMKEMGFEVSKKFVGDYLKVLTDDKLTETGYSQVIESLGIPSDTVIFLLQRDILAQFFDEEYLNSVRGITPIKEFEWFNRFRRMSKIQAAAVEVDSLLDQVPDPSDRELREFFEANKFRVQNPNLEETGFAVPRKSAVEYLVFGYDNIDTGGITDEEVQKYYDENKESYKNTPETNSSGLGLGQPLPGIPGVNNLPFGNRPFPNLNLNRPPSAVPQGNLNLPGIEKRIEEASAENPSTSAEAVPAEPPPLPSEAVPAET
ncbi:MAG: hypothetical protein LBQ54_05225, partial [Planctomycetaceae bacterium]|nr:hypothetical protein [Planctomycetaceae bacterium]